ncbi:MAG TPA: hypothetical protein VIK55_16475, partial [Paludibacter sp.]
QPKLSFIALTFQVPGLFHLPQTRTMPSCRRYASCLAAQQLETFGILMSEKKQLKINGIVGNRIE